MVRIITDSICDLKDDLMEKYNIVSLPLRVRLGEETEYLDKLEVQPPKVWEAMERGIMPKTTQIPLDMAQSLFEKYAADGIDFIYVSFSSVLSGCCQLGKMLVEELKEKYPNVNMGVINSKGGAFGQGSIVYQLARGAAEGVGFDDLMNRGVYMADHVEHIFALGDMKWLVLGGRINKMLGNTGSALDVRPIIHVDREGYLKVIGAVRGQKRMIKSMCDKSLELLKEFPQQLIGISYSKEYSSVEQTMEYLEDKLTAPKYYIQPIGCVLTAHIGLSGVGIQFFNTKIDNYYFEE